MVSAPLLLLFQLVVGDPLQIAEPASQAAVETPATPPADAAEAKPKVVCRMETVTGSRARKQKVCKTEAYNSASDETRRAFQDFQNKASMGGPVGVKQPGGG
jgi:hypothetical protein